MSKIKAVIFDKDGTLHDTEKIFVEAWSLAAEELYKLVRAEKAQTV